jgi:hypothetical protein
MGPSEDWADRRSSPRVPTASRVYVLAPGRQTSRSKIVNVSQGGAFVTWDSDTFPVGPQVTLVLVKRQERVVTTVRRRAVVMRRSVAGLGLKFIPVRTAEGDRSDSEQFANL